MPHSSRPSFPLGNALGSPVESIPSSARSSLTINYVPPVDTIITSARSPFTVNRTLSISAGPTLTEDSSPSACQLDDIEHTPVQDDPRAWSSLRKNVSLALISFASLISGLAGTIQNPAVEDMKNELPATSAQISWSIAVFILVQGLMPLIWSAISEVKGRKIVYLVSLVLFSIGSMVVALSPNILLVIGFRSLQAAGSSAVITIGAATLTDMFEPAERGTKMGVYYMAPLLGPSIGPLVGGALTQGLHWRGVFWFVTITSGLTCLLFAFFFHDTFRQERSLTYQNVLKERMRVANDNLEKMTENAVLERKNADPERNVALVPMAIHLPLTAVNPFKPLVVVLRRWNNSAILFASGLLFAFGSLVGYTSARTLAGEYNYTPLTIGLVLVAYGLGSVAGSLLGGRWSDRELARLKAANGGVSHPEMRLTSALYSIVLLPPCVLAFGWICEKHSHVAAICAVLFGCGFFAIWTSSSALAYIVDANTGRASSAVAANSAFRGLAAFVAIETAVPLQEKLGDGWTYTLWAILMLISGLLIVLVSTRGEVWRKRAENREALSERKGVS